MFRPHKGCISSGSSGHNIPVSYRKTPDAASDQNLCGYEPLPPLASRYGICTVRQRLPWHSGPAYLPDGGQSEDTPPGFRSIYATPVDFAAIFHTPLHLFQALRSIASPSVRTPSFEIRTASLPPHF